MANEACGICVPRREFDMHVGDDLGECLRPNAHWDGKHMFRNRDGVYYLWEDDDSCDCCQPEDDERCFVYGEISEKEALELIAKRD
jgi:hypothetical protein